MNRRLPWGLIMIAGSVLLFGSAQTFAQQGPAISSGFRSSDTNLVQGSIVSTLANDAAAIELATIESSQRLAGVVSSEALLKLSHDQALPVQVVTGGTTLVLVADINGSIRAGDKITISPFNGVGMLATNDGQIIGTALESFDQASASRREATDRSGKVQTVHINTIPVHISVTAYTAPSNQFIPPFLTAIATNIAGRPVPALRIVLGLILILLAFSSIFVLIYTSVRASMVSLGRNPLAARAIHKGLAGVMAIVVLIMVSALVLTYIILTF